MSTGAEAVSRTDQIECGNDLHALLCGLEADSSLFQPARQLERLIALDDLDAAIGDGPDDEFAGHAGPSNYQRAKRLRARLEAANAELYDAVRADIVRSGQSRMLMPWLRSLASGNEPRIPGRGLAFDYRDELVSGVLQLREPGEPDLHGSTEMVPYQPTPVRHILQLIEAAAVTKEDVFVDLGSGLGHVPLMVSVLSGARSIGIEVQPGYVASARACAGSLQLNLVRFMLQDAREADLSSGTVFYLYSPFNGSILAEVLSALRLESTRRPIRICTLGPCALAVANEAWLRASAQPDTGCVTVFHSR